MEHINTFDEHIKNPNLSVGRYIRSKCIALSKTVNSKKIVYFDTKFWLIIRDVALGRSESTIANEFYQYVISLAEKELFIFPISQDVFIEILKQTDPTTLHQTVDLVDKLSLGVSLISFEERIALETKNFFLSSSGKIVYECQEMVWTKLSYNMGFVTPTNQCLTPNMDSAIQKAFIDQMWSVTLTDIINITSENGEALMPSMPQLSAKLNEGKFNHSHENRSFKQMFLSEIAGALDAYKTIIASSLEEIYEQETGGRLLNTEKDTSDSNKLLCNSIYNLFRLNKAQSFFSTLNITSGLHASIRWDKNQKYQDNDMHDIRHAASALPYCDAFFTEKRLAHLITQKATSYNKHYSCSIASSISDAIKILKGL
jgi:hypothetical protein